MGTIGTRLFFINYYLPNQIFLEIAYPFFFLICWYNTYKINLLDSSLIDWDRFV